MQRFSTKREADVSAIFFNVSAIFFNVSVIFFNASVIFLLNQTSTIFWEECLTCPGPVKSFYDCFVLFLQIFDRNSELFTYLLSFKGFLPIGLHKIQLFVKFCETLASSQLY